ncbi:MAG: imidazolonepropionase, partial [Phycisphaerales bacterium]|nr:imidazolonepropionase [Phycisphaerales bacterium]
MDASASTPDPRQTALVIRGARVLTLGESPWPRRGHALGDLSVFERSDVLCQDGVVRGVGRNLDAPPGAREIEANGRVLMPAFIDCHTHLCWAGSRIDEWEKRLAGASYLEILDSGGGIMATVRAVRAATTEQLAAGLLDRLIRVLHAGTTTVEIKSGYGLSTDHELKMLAAIENAAELWPGTVVPTALLGHAKDPGVENFAQRTVEETLPAVSEAYPGIAIDAFCEKSAWKLDDTILLFEQARQRRHPLRVHADQFNSMGMTPAAIRLGARSVDHLEASTDADLRALADSSTFGVILPCCGFHVDNRYARGRAFLDHNGLLAIATNANPGSAPCSSMPMAIALAVRACGLTPWEAIGAATANAAALLGFTDRGVIVE